MPPVTRRQAILTTAAVGAGAWAAADDPKPVRVLVVVGPTNHPPGTHEVAAGGRLIKHGLETARHGSTRRIQADIVTEWPANRPEDVAAVVFIGDLFPPMVMADSARIMADLTALAARGCGMVCVHYATGLEAKHVTDDGDHPLLRWIGGYFATRCKHHASVARVFQKATIEPTKTDHPILRGWKPFTLHDEPYINNYFGKNGPAAGVTVLATAELPPEKPKTEPVAWATERPDGGRGVGVVMPHFYRNWANDDLRTLLFNAMIWAAKLDVPADGVRVRLPDLAEFKPVSVEPIPKKPAPAWTMSSPLFRLAKPDGDEPIPLVDPAVVRHDGKWHLFAGSPAGVMYYQLDDFRTDGPPVRGRKLSLTGGGAVPQVYFHRAAEKWHLIGHVPVANPDGKNWVAPGLSTNARVDDPSGWSPMAKLDAEFPRDEMDKPVRWMDFYVIFDDDKAHLFGTSSGHLWRSETAARDFPRGWSRPVAALKGPIVYASHTYRRDGGGGPRFVTYLTARGPDPVTKKPGQYQASYVADRLDGPWVAERVQPDNPFVGFGNARIDDARWGREIVHGEPLREGADERMILEAVPTRFIFHARARLRAESDAPAVNAVGVLERVKK